MSNRIKQKKKKLRTEVGPDKRSVKTRGRRAGVIGTNGPKSAIWQAKVEVELSGTKLVACGTALVNAEATVEAIQSQLDTAINVRDGKIVEFDAAYSVYAANVEAHATTPEEFTALGLTLLARNSHELKAPIGVDAWFDVVKRRVQIHVDKAPGMTASIVEVSPNPADPDGWKRLPGFGAIHKLSGYEPGTLWVRAASARASEISDFTAPVPVVVT